VTASEVRTLRIERLAPTGEGVVRGEAGVGFVERALPGELVATNVYQVKKSFWRGAVRAVLEPSPDRVSGPHAGCAGCDWAHFDASAARRAKRELFLETLRRIGGIDPASVPGGRGRAVRPRLPPAQPPPRCGPRTRRRARVLLAAFAPRRAGDACDALSRETRELLPALRDAVAASGAAVAELVILEAADPSRRLLLASAAPGRSEAERLADALAPLGEGTAVRSESGRIARRGERRLPIEVGARTLHASAGAFFQGNRHLLAPLYGTVAAEAAGAPRGRRAGRLRRRGPVRRRAPRR
jgi:tRNA/tmRNA/rRNA uracil-C5-methylase (TrmA/RlmC/RlmD family)